MEPFQRETNMASTQVFVTQRTHCHRDKLRFAKIERYEKYETNDCAGSPRIDNL